MRPAALDDMLWRCYRAAKDLTDALDAADERSVARIAARLLTVLDEHVPTLRLAVEAIAQREREDAERENRAAEGAWGPL